MQNDNNPGKGLGIASLVLGICGLVVPYAGLATSIVGLILGIIGKKKSKEANAPTSMATAGIVLSIIGLAGAIIIVIILSVAAIGFVTMGISPVR